MIPLSTLNQKIKRLGIDVRRRGRGDETLSAPTVSSGNPGFPESPSLAFLRMPITRTCSAF